MEERVERIIITGGQTKSGEPEPVQQLEIEAGEIIAVVGPTGSGKSMLLNDIEQMAIGDTPSQRRVEIETSNECGERVIAQLSQTMNFVIDMTVADFLDLHAASRGLRDPAAVREEVIHLANELVGESFRGDERITTLSGGQSRALMIADIALISNAPIVLIDEIENAGIDRLRALKMLAKHGKIVLIASHDPLIILMADRRLVMRNGGMTKLLLPTDQEQQCLDELLILDEQRSSLCESLRNGDSVNISIEKVGVQI